MDLDPNFSAKCPGREKPATHKISMVHIAKVNIYLTVVSMQLIVSKHMYATTHATAGLSLCHHHTAVVPNQVPVMPRVSPKLATNAQGESPPVKKRPRP